METITKLAPTAEISDAFWKHYKKFRGINGGVGEYERIMVSISGGSDSDVLIDMIERIGYEPGIVHYVFFNTGIEFQATKDHIKELEEKYGVEIEERRAKMPTAIACHKYGQPFLSKRISDYASRLQKHGFQWEDEPFETLKEKYHDCESALKWWCNAYEDGSKLNIKRRKYLKEFMTAYLPNFAISSMCCQKAKKDTAHDFEKEFVPDLNVQGIRKDEGGSRSITYKNCFDDISCGCSRLRPLFWFSDMDKQKYCATFDVEHSRCYTQYGMKRGGCACCPFGRDFEQELEAAKKYEPKLYKAANLIFGDSYDYTRKYKDFCVQMKLKEKGVV